MIAAANAATGEADIARAQIEFPTACQPAFTATIAKVTDETTVIMDIADARRSELSEMSHSTRPRSSPKR